MANQTTAVAELILRLRDEVSGSSSKIDSSLKMLQGSLAGLQRAVAFLGVGLGVGVLIGFGKSVVDVADQIADLSKRTGISGQVLSGLKPVLEQNGSSLEAFAKGVNIAQRNLGQVTEEGDTAALAVKALGLNLDELRNTTPDRFVELIANALGKVENPIRRSALAFQLLGRSAAELVPAFLAMAGSFAELKKQGMSDEDIARLKAFTDNLNRLSNSIQVMASAPLAKLAALFEVMRGAPLSEIDQLSGELAGLQRGLKNLEATRSSLLGKLLGTEDLDKEIADLKVAIKEKENLLNSAKAKAAAAKTPPPFVPLPSKGDLEETKRLLAEGLKDMFAGIDEAQKAAIAGGKEMIAVFGELDSEGMAPLEKILAEINRHFDEMKMKGAAAFEAAGISSEDAASRLAQLEFFRRQALLAAETGSTPADALDAEAGKRSEDFQKRTQDLGQTISDLNERMANIAVEAQIFGASFDSTGEAINAITAAIRRMIDNGLTPADPKLRELKAQLDGLKNLQTVENAFDSLFRGIEDGLLGARQGTQSFAEALKNTLRNALSSLSESLAKRFILEPLKAQLSQFLSTTFPSIFGTGGPLGGLVASEGKDIALTANTAALNAVTIALGGAVPGALGGGGGGLLSLLGLGGGRPPGVEGPLMEGGGFFSGGGGGFDLSGMLKGITDQLSSMMSGLMETLSSLLSGLGSGLSSLFSSIGSFIFGLFHQGGFVGLDGLPAFAFGGEVPILAQPGEFIMRRAASQRLGRDNLDYINQFGRLPAGDQPMVIHLHQVFDYSGTIDPRGMKTTAREVRQYVVHDLKHGHEIRTTLKQDRGL